MKWGISKNRNTDPVKCFGAEDFNEHTAPWGTTSRRPYPRVENSCPPNSSDGHSSDRGGWRRSRRLQPQFNRDPIMSYLHLLCLLTAGKAPPTWSRFLRGLMLALASPPTPG